jgi:hypothetical protein
MTYTPTGNEGDAAASAGLAVFTGNEAAADIYVLLNVRGDEIAAVLAVIGDGITWSTITGKPATFTPSAHGHGWAEISGKPELVALGYLNDRIGAGGSQPIYNPHGRANPVVTGWVAAALDSSGRIAIQPSTRRLKHDLGEYTGSALDLVPSLFTMRDDPEQTVHLGFIAEQVDETIPEAVIVDEGGDPLALDHNAILAALVADVRRLSTRVAELERNAG